MNDLKSGERVDEQSNVLGSSEADAALAAQQPASGQILDYISGRPVRATSEEVEAVQVFARRLVEDFGYPKEVITTRPQYRVRARPSGASKRGYPVDIAVFTSERKLEDDLFMVVECKKPTVKEGERQLKLYLTMCQAVIGVWFNGKDHLYLHKKYLPDGTLGWSRLPTIPKWGQSVSDIGLLKRRDLGRPSNLKSSFKDIRNHLAGNTTGITRDQELATQLMYILFAKIHDEIETAPDDLPRFRATKDEPPKNVKKRIEALFTEVKSRYDDVFDEGDRLTLDGHSVHYVVGELQNFALTEASRDAIGEAFEVFISPAVRGDEGQFFTPRNVVQMMVKLLDPSPDEVVIDPACGSGGFLTVALEHMWSKVEAEGARKGWTAAQVERRKRDVATRAIRGIDKDAFLVKVAKAYMAIIGDGRGGIFCEDSLAEPSDWRPSTRDHIKLGTFHCVLTNPPFGSKIRVTGEAKLAQYKLAKRWKAPKKGASDWTMMNEVRTEQTPQILFIERCIQLLRPGGRLAIILPESIFGMPVYGYVVQYLYDNYRLRAFISMPEDLFQPYTHAKTCVLILQNSPPDEDEEIEMAIADWCGHDSRGNPTKRISPDGREIVLDDIPKIADHLGERLRWE